MRRKRLALPPALGAAGPYAAPKEEANVSSSEAVLGMQLVLPAQAALAQHVDTAETREEIPSTVKTYAEAIREEPVKRGSFVYIRNGPAGKPLSPTYSSPYEVLESRGKAVQLQMGARTDWVAVERLKRHRGDAIVEPALPPARGRPPNLLRTGEPLEEARGRAT